MFILKKGHLPGVYVPLMALFLVYLISGGWDYFALSYPHCIAAAPLAPTLWGKIFIGA